MVVDVMWDLPKGDLFLPKVSLEELECLYAAENRAKPKIRLLCAIHRKNESSIDEIADVTSLKRRTVHALLRRFHERGINAKDAIKQTGRPAFLTFKQRKELVKQLEIGPPQNRTGLWSTKEAKEYIHKKYNVTYTNVHVWELLKALGFSLQRPRPIHRKAADAQEIERFKKKLPGWHAIIEKKTL
jgi:transposase